MEESGLTDSMVERIRFSSEWALVRVLGMSKENWFGFHKLVEGEHCRRIFSTTHL